MLGLLLLGFATQYEMLLAGAALIGVGSAVFHPEASRVARMASGGRYGLAQSVFQVGGNFGTAIGPLLAAFIVVPRGQGSVGWFSIMALVGMIVLWQIGNWYVRYQRAMPRGPKPSRELLLPRKQDRLGAGGARHAGLHQAHLHGRLHQLLHLLRHRAFRRHRSSSRSCCCSSSSAGRRSASSSAGRWATGSAPRR
jgi:MFS family permease